MFERMRKIISEIIGSVHIYRRHIYSSTVGAWQTRDIGQADYAFYDKLRRGKAQGYELGGLLVKPIISKIAGWTLGRPVQFRSDVTDVEPLNDWWTGNMAEVIRAYKDSMGLGDSYLVVNADLSVTVVPPHVVDPIVDEADYSRVIGYKITERWPHPTRAGVTMTIIDEYTPGQRVRTTQRDGATVNRETFSTPFLEDYVPVIPLRNNVGVNETHGTPELEASVPALARYGAALDVSIEGLKRSTPVIEFPTATDLATFWDTYAESTTRTLPDGTTETYQTIPFSSDEVMAIVGKMYYANPASTAADAERMLIMLYLLIIEHAEVPEFVMGSAISSSKASATEQTDVWVRYVEMRRSMAREWVLQLMIVVQLLMVARGELGAVDYEINLLWEKLTTKDGALTLDAVRWAVSEGYMDGETALKLIPADIDDVAGVLEAAQKERDEAVARQAAPDYGDDLDRAMRRITNQPTVRPADDEQAEAA